MKKKYNKLKKFLSNLREGVIAFSGGVDSALLAKIAFDVLGKKSVAVTAHSAIHSRDALKEAKKTAKDIGIRHQVVYTQELNDKKFKQNLKDRCYWCKREMFLELRRTAMKNKIKHLLDGTNFDDRKDFRPGLRANEEMKVISPLRELEFSKQEVVTLAKSLGLACWNKPRDTCLATRIPYPDEITAAKLSAVEKAESILRNFFGRDFIFRARYHHRLLRVELENRAWTKLKKSDITRIAKKIKKLGFKSEISPYNL